MGFEREEYYLPIPSLNYRYEISKAGRIRNAKTKKLVTNREPRSQGYYVHLYLNETTRVKKTVADLLWEVHGIEPARNFPAAKTVYVSKNGEYHCFKSYRQCVDFLLGRTPKKKTWLFKRLQQKSAEIYGWQILYRAS